MRAGHGIRLSGTPGPGPSGPARTSKADRPAPAGLGTP